MKRKQLYIDADHATPAIAGTRIVHRDPSAWAQARAFIKALARRPSRPGARSTRTWTRDQLYDERVSRLLR